MPTVKARVCKMSWMIVEVSIVFILIVFSLTIEVYATISYNGCFFCRTDTNQLERDGSDTSANA